MTQAESAIISLYGNSPRMKIVDYLMIFPKNEFAVSEIVDAIGMSRTTAYREISELFNNEMIIQTKQHGKLLTFKINSSSPIIYSMQKLVSHRSKKIATSQMRNTRLMSFIRKELKSMDELINRETMLKTELELTRNMKKTIPVQ